MTDVQVFRFGISSLGTPITAFRIPKAGAPRVLVLGGVHGDESEGVIGALSLLEQAKSLPVDLTIVPLFNVDGVLRSTRVNGRGVDLNRNLPTKDWNAQTLNPRYPPGPHANSESENQALTERIDRDSYDFILSLHSFKNPTLNVNGDCDEIAAVISKATGYAPSKDMGYPTPGCLGTYTGHEKQIPTLTYELLRGMPSSEIVSKHVPAILQSFSKVKKRSSHD